LGEYTEGGLFLPSDFYLSKKTSFNMNLKSYFGVLTILFWALCAGQVLFLGVVYFFIAVGKPLDNWLGYLVLVLVSLIALVIGQRIGKSRLLSLVNTTVDWEKLQGYRALSLIRWAANEFGTLMMIVGYQLTGQPIFLGFAIGFLFLFLLQRPTKDKITQEAQLTPNEIKLLDAEMPLPNNLD
jgi:hypothetical protein